MSLPEYISQSHFQLQYYVAYKIYIQNKIYKENSYNDITLTQEEQKQYIKIVEYNVS